MPLPAHMRVNVIIRETATNKEHKFGLFYRLDSGSAPDAATILSFANDFKTAFGAALPPVLTTAHAFSGVECIWTSGSTQVDARSNSAESAGTVSGDVMPEEVAVLLQRRTGLTGRDKRGRVFMPCVPDSFVVGSTLSTGAVAAYNNVAQMMANAVAAGEGPSDFKPTTPSYKTSTLNDIVQVRVLSEVVSRRDRRFVKRGFIAGTAMPT